jgi:hypothetical protein
MKALVVYNSIAQGNTAKIAKVIARVLEAKLLKPSEISEEMVRECSLMGFGSGIYFQKHHRSLHTLVAQLSELRARRPSSSRRADGGIPSTMNPSRDSLWPEVSRSWAAFPAKDLTATDL